MKKPALVDTNFMGQIFFPNLNNRPRVVTSKVVFRQYQVIQNSVSLVEFGRGLSNDTKLLTGVHKNLSNSETIFPSLEDWKKSLYT